MTTANIHLIFNGNCRQAMSFYKDCLEGELFLLTVGESPVRAEFPAAMGNQIMHASLTKDGLVIMGTDLAGPGFSVGANFGIFINCTSEEEVNTFFERFAQAGQILMPVQQQFWGALYGEVKDPFGIRWMFSYAKNQHA